MQVLFQDLAATISHRAGSQSLMTEVSLGSLVVNDCATANAQFPRIVGPVVDLPTVGLAGILVDEKR